MIKFNVKRFEMNPDYYVLAVNAGSDLASDCGEVESIRWSDIMKLINASGTFREKDKSPTHVALQGVPTCDRDEVLYRISVACSHTSSIILETILKKMQAGGSGDHLVIDLQDKTLDDRERSYYIRGIKAPSALSRAQSTG